MARAPDTMARARADWPGTAIYASLTEMIAAGVCDTVTITTPPQTRRSLVLQAIAAGLHVIADKPFAADAAGALELDRAAKAKVVVLGVYQNRRFDADLQTLRKVISDERLGKVWRIESRMDQDGAHMLEPVPTGGLLRDSDSHVVDQMIYLLGPVAAVDPQMDFVSRPVVIRVPVPQPEL